MECLVYNLCRSKDINNKSIEKIVLLILKLLKQRSGNASVSFVNEKKIKAINYQYRGKNKITDVISFPAREGEKIGKENDWGDIFICLPQIKRQAKEFGIIWQEEMIRMLAHGILHLLGYDHQNQQEEKKMMKLQERMVEKCADIKIK